MLFSKRQKQDPEIVDKLLTAVVSVYLYMARTAKLKGEEINFIDRVLHSMFGNDIPLYKIEQARQQVLSLRNAANFLADHLREADRLKIVLNLISLAYHDRDKIHVMGSLEIVELTDLLRLEVSTLDAIYDLFEGKTETIDLPAAVSVNGPGKLRNSMLWAPSGGDFKFLGPDAKSRLVFIMIESLLLLYPDTCEETGLCSIVTGEVPRILQPRRFHRIQDNCTLLIKGCHGEIRISPPDIWQIYNLGMQSTQIPWPEAPSAGSKLSHRKHRFYLETPTKTRLYQSQELALDEAPNPLAKETVISLLTRELDSGETIFGVAEYYLIQDKQGLALHSEASSAALLHFYTENELLRVEKHGDKAIFVNRVPLLQASSFVLNQDIISIGDRNLLINRNWELIEIPIQIDELFVQEISHTFPGGKTALSGITFRLPKSRMMAIMGPSGSGKTTLLQVLLGDLKASCNRVLIDGMDLEANFPFFQKYIGYVPQDDLLFPNLTVYENLHYRLRLANANLSNKQEIRTRIQNLLHSVGLFEQQHMIVGDVLNKKLSGGQRRRLNIALELILNPVIIIMDEPTSGLSSKDSENIAEFLCELKEQNKLIICTIHQPNPTVFSSFDSVLLLDKGGRQVFFGDSKGVFDYFAEELASSGKRQSALKIKRDLQMPDYFYDLIESVDNYGKRCFPADYWERKYRDYSFRKAMDTWQGQKAASERPTEQKLQQPKAKTNLHSLLLLVQRTFLNKTRSKMNLIMTLLVAPILAAATSFVLRGVPEGQPYSFSANSNVLLFGFISIISFIFIGLANSIDDLLNEKRSIQRELKLNIPAFAQLVSKHLVLLFMTLIQVLLFYHISALVLGMRGFMLPQSIFLLLSGITGYSLGLLVSSLIKDRGAIVSILPLIIIPQIMFSGAVIRFAEMNSSLRLNSKSEIPEFCQLVPSRWLFEGWTVASARLNQVELRKSRFISEARDSAKPIAEYMAMVDSYNLFVQRHPEESHANELIRSSVKLAHGQYLNEGRNIFLSHRTFALGKERASLWLDAIVALILIWISTLATWLRIRHRFR